MDKFRKQSSTNISSISGNQSNSLSRQDLSQQNSSSQNRQLTPQKHQLQQKKSSNLGSQLRQGLGGFNLGIPSSNDPSQVAKNRVSVIEKVEMQNPYIRQFGKKNFNVQSYLDEVLSKNDSQMIKQEYKGLKKSHQSLQREIGNFLFQQYHNFLETSDKLENIKYQVEDAKAILSQFSLVINTLRAQIERFDHNQSEFQQALESKKKESKSNKSQQSKGNPSNNQGSLFESAQKGLDELQYISEQLEMIEQQISLNKFEDALNLLTDINTHIDQLETDNLGSKNQDDNDFNSAIDYEQLVLIRASSDQLRNNIDQMLVKQISLHMRQQDLQLALQMSNSLSACQAYLNYQQKILQGKFKKLEPMQYQVMTMQQCQQQQQRLQQSVSTFVEFINATIKDFNKQFLNDQSQSMSQDEQNSIRTCLSQWLKTQTDQLLSLHLSLYLQNELIQHKLGENLKMIMRSVQALQTASVNLSWILERSLTPMVLNALDKVMNERINNQQQEKGLSKHKTPKTSLDTMFIVDNYQLKNLAELEEEKKQDNFESVISIQSLRKHFFRKTLRFLDKHIIQNLDYKCYPFASTMIANFMLIRFMKKLDVVVEREELAMQNANIKGDYMTRHMINEFSSVQVIRLLQQYFTLNDFKLVKQTNEQLQQTLLDQRNFYTNRFKKLYYKDLLIKLVQSVLKDPTYEQTFFSDDVIDYQTIKPAYCFLQMTNYLNELKQKIESDLKLDDESQVFHAKIVFKEHLQMFMLSQTLELLRDILLHNSFTNDLESKYPAEFRDYLTKLVVDKKFSARFVGNSGTQHLMFGIWYMVLTAVTSQVTTKEVKGSSESQRVTSYLQLLTGDIQTNRKSIISRESMKKCEFNMELFKNRILDINNNNQR
eukprot:403369312